MQQIQAKAVFARNLQGDGKVKEARAALDEIENLKQEYQNEKSLYELEKENVPDNTNKKPENRANGFEIMAKMLKKKSLDEAENALIVGGDSGEGYLVPEDVDTTIRELRKSYVSAKELLTVEKTTELSGSFTYESGTPAGLEDFEDGNEISEEGNMIFVLKKWAIKFKGKIFPISNILLGAEKAGLVGYLNRWFVRNAIISENKDIFTMLKTGKTAKKLIGLADLKSSLNKDLDPSCLIDGVIVTNQTGFDNMDKETDAVGRPMLTVNIANPSEKMFGTCPIKVFPDAQLPNISGKAPIFYGSLKAGGMFIEKMGLEFATSEHVLFKKNQTCMRVIEGYDVQQMDTTAYEYATYELPAEKIITVKNTSAPTA